MGVVIAEYRILYDKFDNMAAAGPIPTFFSENPDATLSELKKRPEFGFQCLQALVSKLLARGELTRYN